MKVLRITEHLPLVHVVFEAVVLGAEPVSAAQCWRVLAPTM